MIARVNQTHKDKPLYILLSEAKEEQAADCLLPTSEASLAEALDAASDKMSSVDLRSFRPFGDGKTHCNPKRVCKMGDSCKPPAASAAGAIPGHCLGILVISRRQYGW